MRKDWEENKPTILHSYHMGCYGAFPAVRAAAGHLAYLRDEGRNPQSIQIVHNEICSLHLDAYTHTPEQFVVQSLFADGHMRYRISSPESKTYGDALGLLAIKEDLIPNSEELMVWTPHPWGFAMSLSRLVPEAISQNIRKFVVELIAMSGLRLDEVLKHGWFAIHPGGPKIIDLVQQQLELQDEQIRHSRKILFERGNMSSVTVPHIWQSMLEDGIEDGKIIVSLAFGPGLTVYGSVMKGLKA